MKYERVSQEELHKLDKEFIDFLVVNGITAKDWINLKENEPLVANEIIDQFSDVVWESILRSTSYLQKIEENKAYYFKCDKNTIHLIMVDDTSNLKKSTEKKYTKIRELEIFEMIKKGCQISDGKYFELLNQ